jgi:hypothetical protein
MTMATARLYESRNVDILVNYIKSHGIEAHELNGQIFVHNWHEQDGERYCSIDTVDSNVIAVREFLGY